MTRSKRKRKASIDQQQLAESETANRLSRKQIAIGRRQIAIGVAALMLAAAGVWYAADGDVTYVTNYNTFYQSVPLELDSSLRFEVPKGHDSVRSEVDRRIEQGEAIPVGTLIRIGNVEYIKGNLTGAWHYYNSVLDLAHKAHDTTMIAVATSNVGMLQLAAGDTLAATSSFRESYNLYQHLRGHVGLAAVLGHMAMVCEGRGEFDSAIQLHRRSLEIVKKAKQRDSEAADLCNIGMVYRKKEMFDSALWYCKEALRIDDSLNNRHGESEDLGNLGVIYASIGDTAKALSLFDASLQISRGRFPKAEAIVLSNLGFIQFARGEKTPALSALRKSIELMDAHGFTYGRAQIEEVISEIESTISKPI